MPYKSPYVIDLPQTDLLTYLFSSNGNHGHDAIWLNAANTSLSLSKCQAQLLIKRLAVGLKKLGVKQGDVVMIFSPNHIFVPVAYLGIIGYGAIFTGASTTSVVAELTYQIENTGANLLLFHPSLSRVAIKAAEKAGLPRDRLLTFSDIDNAAVSGALDWRSVLGLEEEAAGWDWERLDAEQAGKRTALINYSSGTTGLPKGVCISQSNIIANVEQGIFVRNMEQSSKPVNSQPERWLGFLPLYHAYGQLFSIVMACKLGVPIYVMADFHYEPFLRHVQDHKITHLQTAPPLVVMLSKRPETSRYDLSSLREIICGAAPLSKDLQNDVSGRFGLLIRQTWGGTELTCSATTTPGGMREGTGSTGVLHPNMECKLLDDEGREVVVGERGEAHLKGPNVCLGYWKNEKATADAISIDGFYRTGDVVVRDERGMFYVVDRKKEMVKVNGLQVAPAELEAILLENEDIADAAVVGVMRGMDEWLRAYVVLKPHRKGQVDESAIQTWMSQRVAKHKRLQGGVVFIEEVPKSATGKIQRNIIRGWSNHGSGATERQLKASL